MSELTKIYQDAIRSLQEKPVLLRSKKENPRDYIVATHGPALAKAITKNPELLNLIGIYRFNCSHLGKETDLHGVAGYIREIHKYVPILIDLQWPKPRIHEMSEEIGDKMIMRVGDEFQVTYAPGNSSERFCTYNHLKVCFPEIVGVMEVWDSVIFDDGKMTAIVRGKSTGKAMLECIEIQNWDPKYILKGRKWICVRNRPLGIDCMTQHDHKSVKFARDMLWFDFVDNIMVSYFSTTEDVEHFVDVMRNTYNYNWNLGGKFETPYAVYSAETILAQKKLSLVMLGRGDLRVEMDPRAVSNMHDIQRHFFSLCQRYNVESICATGYLESMLTPEGKVTGDEIYDMEQSVLTWPDHLMLSGESTYGAQAAECVMLESTYQRSMNQKLAQGIVSYKQIPTLGLWELLYIL